MLLDRLVDERLEGARARLWPPSRPTRALVQPKHLGTRGFCMASARRSQRGQSRELGVRVLETRWTEHLVLDRAFVGG